MEKGDIEKAFESSLKLLSYRPRSKKEVYFRLKKQGYSIDIIEAVVKELEARGYLDDESFARYWLENREDFSPRAKSLIKFELKAKGVDEETVDNVLNQTDDGQNAYNLLVKKLARFKELEYGEFYRKSTSLLRRRGFSYEVIREVTNKIWSEVKK